MICHSAIRPAWIIARACWSAQRMGFLALLSTILVCGIVFHLAGPAFLNLEPPDMLSYLPMALSIFLTFVFCNFTETDRRGRLTGFPARLFTLPVRTETLIAAPLLFGIVAVWVVYAGWAKLVLPALGHQLPLVWPCLYLATGMTCYQAIVWSLARFRIARLLALGVGGTALAIGWIAFRNDFDYGLISGLVPISNGLPVRPILCATLVTVTFSAFLVAYAAVELQRRGGCTEWQGLRRFIELTTDAWPRRQQHFNSPSRAQFWFEWRRHGILLPLSTTGVLMVIMSPAPFVAPISDDSAGVVLCWILLLPLLLAFTLGKGFGKADLWSRDAGLPLFLATRPLSNTAWICAKMKAAGLAALTSWLIVVILTIWWATMWCDWQWLNELWRTAKALYPGPVLYALPVLLFGVLVVLTWRLLIGSLFIGLSGRNWMLTTAACGVFSAIFGGMFLMLAMSQHPIFFRDLIKLPAWLPWLLAGLFAAKVGAAFLVTNHAHRQGWVTNHAISRYLALWLAGTTFLVLAVWLVIPVEGWLKWLSALVALFTVPLLRVVCAPIALARNRGR